MAVSAVLALFVLIGLATPASAASYAKAVYTPVTKGEIVEGWADINTDCEGTFGCWTYIKMEFLPDNPARVPWLNYAAWEHVDGRWASPGWNMVSTNYYARGCGQYRVVVDSYNDAIGDAVLGVSLGPVEMNLGSGIKRYHKSFVSTSIHLCPLA